MQTNRNVSLKEKSQQFKWSTDDNSVASLMCLYSEESAQHRAQHEERANKILSFCKSIICE